MSKFIDLSKLKHKELPTKTLEIEVLGEPQKITIKPINGRGLTSLGLISEDDIDRSAKMCLIALMYGLNLTQNEAELFMNNDIVAADTIAAAIIEFTGEYTQEIASAKDYAKKNSKEKIKK